jgi:hypothetical protein
MNPLKLLYVEDKDEDLNTCRDTVVRYEYQTKRKIELVVVKTVTEALDKIDRTYDGAIVDLKLDHDWDDGLKVIDAIRGRARMPIAILTATPRHADNSDSIGYLGVYKKGEIGYDQLFEIFFQVYDTGLTKIMGGRGLIDTTMDKIFWEHILPLLDAWKGYASEGKSTEQILLRFAVSHLLELLDDDTDTFVPEEMYICPPIASQVKTGSLVQAKDTDCHYVVLSPACDLVLHNGKPKTTHILCCEIEKLSDAIKEIATGKESKEKKRAIQNLISNTFSHYYHFLPQTKLVAGGVINFRKVVTAEPKTFKETFGQPIAQISAAFAKDLVARFSSYYARQGQPEFDSKVLSSKLTSVESQSVVDS